ncbi:hypothetical protein CpipJ_CPIJ000026 [Culex quinquefasciatus]|uniref:Uncharacterized protein n=1 Tax=Culex quinquefasciatus TaxID=7176 RepID=B0VZ57_CULQU|nr:hypothetical protein CpipJ_CPIJ000026 [Culex quinquefasciatus]|eukprot:XP_001841696.1 hypothetical protein CpipJ_CPIJ000026 [Culex quinquefasciatus]
MARRRGLKDKSGFNVENWLDEDLSFLLTAAAAKAKPTTTTTTTMVMTASDGQALPDPGGKVACGIKK